ncbi:unnamed protein product [Brachionus calyciflorus]|uniref:CCHC-type domain-containing protein n=1 Tax=Brachionus calyciflorus TaxID=104777 RepID=A0A814JSR9_9BILA|nr:unnamed protein product [Brachionus calyciflorus]
MVKESMMMLGQYPDQSHSYVNALTNEQQNRHSRTAPYPTPSKRNVNVPNMNSFNQYPFQYYTHQQQQPLLFTNTPIYPNQFNNQFHSYYSPNQQENSLSQTMNNQLTSTQQTSNHTNHFDDKIYDHIPSQTGHTNKTITLKFTGKNSPIPNKYRDYFELDHEIKKFKPRISINTAFINDKNELIIKSDDEKSIVDLKNWPDNAFECGLSQVIKQSKYYLALHNVDTSFNITSENIKNYVKENYQIDNMLRMIKKSSNKPLTLVKAVTSCVNSFNKTIQDGYIKIGYTRIKVTAWKFGTTPDQCFKCQKFGHSQNNCKSKDFICLRCAGKHHYKDCKITNAEDYICANCNLNHASCSKECKILQEAVNKKQNKQESNNNQNFIRIESNFKNQKKENQVPTLNLITLLIDIFKNLNKIQSTIDYDPTPFLDLIHKHLGQECKRKIAAILVPVQEHDPEMDQQNAYIENENDQQ